MVLKMLRRDVTRIQHVQTFPVAFHAVARNTVGRLLGTLHVKGHAGADAQCGKYAQAYEGENLAHGFHSDRGTHEKYSGQHDRQYDQRDEDPG
jgi:hypothetical protein